MEGVLAVLVTLAIILYCIHRYFKIKNNWKRVAILNQGIGYLQGLTESYNLYGMHGNDPDRFQKEMMIKVRKANDYYGEYLSTNQRPNSFQEVSETMGF